MSIDYGSIGRTALPHPNGGAVNRNPETGIRYGIASQHDVSSYVLDDMDADYPHNCPECGAELADDFETPDDCPTCGYEMAPGEEWGEEPIRHYLEEDGVSIALDSDGDVWIYASPVITTGRHCSPCAPGAVSVGPEAVEDGPEAYGLPAEWWRGEDD